MLMDNISPHCSIYKAVFTAKCHLFNNSPEHRGEKPCKIKIGDVYYRHVCFFNNKQQALSLNIAKKGQVQNG